MQGPSNTRIKGQTQSPHHGRNHQIIEMLIDRRNACYSFKPLLLIPAIIQRPYIIQRAGRKTDEMSTLYPLRMWRIRMQVLNFGLIQTRWQRSEERRVGKECRWRRSSES